MTKILLPLLLFISYLSHAQNLASEPDKELISFDGKKEVNYTIDFRKNKTYLIKVYQEHIDIELSLYDADNRKIAATDLADGEKGYDKLEFTPQKPGRYRINIRSITSTPVPQGKIRTTITTLSKADLNRRKQSAKLLEAEHLKSVTTIDIQHFWEAYDQLKEARSFEDSVTIIQQQYLDRATNGLKEFQQVRYLAAEFYVSRIKQYRNFYNSVRANTNLFLNERSLSEIIEQTRSLYPEGNAAKIALVVGPMSSGGTLSNNYVLIGIEMLAGDKNCDVSEITNENLKSDILSRTTQADVLNFVKETVAHEYIHTQQKPNSDEACTCVLLDQVIREGVASFIAEALIMKRSEETKSRAASYATAKEKELWQELKNELCTTKLQNWLFNAASSKERPGDLGYRIGYKIAEAYYNSSADKARAVKEMIEMDHPLLFLDQSKYDVKFR